MCKWRNCSPLIFPEGRDVKEKRLWPVDDYMGGRRRSKTTISTTSVSFDDQL